MPSYRSWCAAAAMLLAAGPAVSPARAQVAPAGQVAPDARVTLDLRETPLKDAVPLLFRGSGEQYTIASNVPNVPITLNIRDVSLPSALRLMVRQAASAVPGLVATREGGVY